jgi:TolB-like protein/Tfp pilus assembly protein PilF
VGVTGQHAERRLAAILAADVVSYSRLMSADEAGTLAALKVLRRSLFDPKIAEYGGRVVKLMGDGALAEFPSAVHAVQCATEVQQQLAERYADMSGQPQIRFRIGINLGDIIIDGDDIYGDGVNIAARLEGLAEPGSICIASNVYEQLEGKLDIVFEDGGKHQVKNIPRPVHVWRWRPSGAVAEHAAQHGAVQPPSDKPSIAVLPFENMSDDPEQEYFSDGVTEDIITELSRYPDFLVIARNSTFVYKHKRVDLREIAQNLGVQSVLEGSVRRIGKNVRVSAQLIDATTGAHLWAERYDRTLEDIFAVQDEITETIVGALGLALEETRIKRSRRKDPSSLDAYDKTLQAWAHFWRFNKEDNSEARRLAEEAIALDAGYARAHAIVAWTYLMDFTSHWVDDPDRTLAQAYETARKAVTLDDHNAYAFLGLGASENWLGRHDQAIANMRRAIELNPSDADAHATFANVLVFAGCAGEALEELETAMRLNPHYPGSYMQFLGRAYFTQRRYEEAETAFERAVTVNPGWPWAHLVLAATRAALGKLEEAEAEVAEARNISPALTLRHAPKAWPFKNREDFDHVLEMLRKAGLPE